MNHNTCMHTYTYKDNVVSYAEHTFTEKVKSRHAHKIGDNSESTHIIEALKTLLLLMMLGISSGYLSVVEASANNKDFRKIAEMVAISLVHPIVAL